MSFFSNYFGNSKKLRRVRNTRPTRPSSERRTHLDLQRLEDRVVPAVTAVSLGTSLIVVMNAAGDTAVLSEGANGDVFVTPNGGSTTDTGAILSNLTGGITATGSALTAGQTLTFDSSQGSAISLQTLGGLTSTSIASLIVNTGYIKMAAASTISAVTVASGATLDTNGFAMTDSTLSGAGILVNNNAANNSVFTLATGTTASTFGGTITPAGTGTKTLAITITGTGTFVLNGPTPTVGSALIIPAGETVQLGDGIVTQTGTIATTTVADAGIFAINEPAGGTALFSTAAIVSGAGAMNFSGAGTITINSANTLTGTVSIGAGTIVNANVTAALGNADVTDNGTVSVVGALTVGSLGGSGSVVLGTGILTFGGKSTATTGTLPSFT